MGVRATGSAKKWLPGTGSSSSPGSNSLSDRLGPGGLTTVSAVGATGASGGLDRRAPTPSTGEQPLYEEIGDYRQDVTRQFQQSSATGGSGPSSGSTDGPSGPTPSGDGSSPTGAPAAAGGGDAPDEEYTGNRRLAELDRKVQNMEGEVSALEQEVSSLDAQTVTESELSALESKIEARSADVPDDPDPLEVDLDDDPDAEAMVAGDAAYLAMAGGDRETAAELKRSDMATASMIAEKSDQSAFSDSTLGELIKGEAGNRYDQAKQTIGTALFGDKVKQGGSWVIADQVGKFAGEAGDVAGQLAPVEGAEAVTRPAARWTATAGTYLALEGGRATFSTYAQAKGEQVSAGIRDRIGSVKEYVGGGPSDPGDGGSGGGGAKDVGDSNDSDHNDHFEE